MFRFVLALGVFICLGLGGRPGERSGALDAGLVLLIVAFASDVLDGYLARRNKWTSEFGRIADPIADKVLIAGGYILYAGLPGSIVAPWMVVVIVGRELVVTTLRGAMEAAANPLPTTYLGKAKMFLQCVGLGLAVFWHAHYAASAGGAVYWLALAAVWVTVVVTGLSLVVYVWLAWRMWVRTSRTPAD
jgi:CDP-diacylglycerol--glycerol-3-phosphate 3-phosphatidyltransferase